MENEAPTTASQIDPITDFLSKITVGNEILVELGMCGKDQEKYEKYFRATDLFILNIIYSNVATYEDEPDKPEFKAFCNLIKWMMYMIATNPWWHRKLCYMNRMMGVNTNATSYWHLQYSPYYIPGHHWNENMNQTPKEFNDSQLDQKEIYAWIDKKSDELDDIK